MKKVVWLVLVLILACTMCTIVMAQGEQSTAKKDGDYFFGHSTLYMGDEWMKVTDKAIHLYCEDQGWTVVTQNPDLKAEQQIKDMHYFVAQGVDGIIWSPVDSQACVDVAEYCKENGVPTVTYNTDVETDAVPITVLFDANLAAVTLAEEAVKFIRESRGEVAGVVISLQGDASNDSDRTRAEGYKAVFSKYPNITFVEYFTMSKMDVAQQNTFNAIQQFGKPVAIVSQNTTNARGGMNALEAQGMLIPNSNPSEHVFIASIGAPPDYLDLMKEGLCDRAYVQPNLFYGPLALELLKIVIEKGEDALPAIGSTVTAADILIKGGYHDIGPWEEAVWAPAQVVEIYGHRWLKVQGMLVTPENVDDNKIWGNTARAWLK